MWILAAATAITVVAAGSVVAHPTERIFGAEIVGRHHDPFTVIRQFSGTASVGGPYLQPATDWTGQLLATVLPPVAAYNLIVLLTFPLAAWFAYLLAFELTGSRFGSVVAALVFAFAPVHVAQAAYHPHIAQVQWIPLYFLALWRAVHELTWRRALALLAAGAVAVLANDYHVLLLAAVTPVAALLFWSVPARDGVPSRVRDLISTAALLAVPALAAYAWLRYAVPSAFAIPAARNDLFLYSAHGWSYLVPPVSHPLAGAWARDAWARVGGVDGILEQQVFVGVSVIALSLIALLRAAAGPARRLTWSLAGIAAFALLCSLSPEQRLFGVTVSRPSALLYVLMPMFRSYARFAFVAQLALAVLAGMGAASLWYTRRARVVAVALLALLIAEYWPFHAGARDVLPTSAHRYLTTQLGPSTATMAETAPVFDCTRFALAEHQTPWLAGFDIGYLSPAVDDCGAPALAPTLAALGYRFVIVRGDTPERAALNRASSDELTRVFHADDADVLTVTAEPARVYVTDVQGLLPREYDEARSWRWMGSPAQFTLINATSDTVSGSFTIDAAAFATPRHLVVTIDGAEQSAQPVAMEMTTVSVGPIALTPGPHLVTLASVEPAVSPRSAGIGRDPRALSLQLFDWRWQ